MAKLTFTFFFLFVISIAYGQNNYKLNKNPAKYKYICCSINLLNLGNDSVLTSQSHILNRTSIDSIKLERKKKFIKLYGKKADYGVITIYLTPGTKLFSTGQLLQHFGIQNDDINLPIYIDSTIQKHPTETYFQLSAVRSVKIETEDETNMKYISILSIYKINRNPQKPFQSPMSLDLQKKNHFGIPETE